MGPRQVDVRVVRGASGLEGGHSDSDSDSDSEGLEAGHGLVKSRRL
jgi:hypothetical protein